MKRISKILLAAGFLSFLGLSDTFASALVFQGQNAALFPNANPADTTAMMLSVQRPQNPATASATAGISTASLIEQSVEGQISSKIYNEIFNGTASSGSFNLGGGNLITFTRDLAGNVTINITDPAHGTTTITVPNL